MNFVTATASYILVPMFIIIMYYVYDHTVWISSKLATVNESIIICNIVLWLFYTTFAFAP